MAGKEMNRRTESPARPRHTSSMNVLPDFVPAGKDHMPSNLKPDEASPVTLDRRAWCAAVIGGLATRRVRAEEEDETPESRAAEKRGRELGLKGFRTVTSKHYVAVGNARDAYLEIALRDLEAVAVDFLEHYAAKGFPVAAPERRMTAVVLEDERAFARFLPSPVPYAAIGVYLAKENWLVLEDFRHVARPLRSIPAWAENLETLAHEGTHQLCFNTGLLVRRADTPRSIVEGLAEYGELRRPEMRSPPGQLNRGRLATMAHSQREFGWIPVPRLLTDDDWQVAGEEAKDLRPDARASMASAKINVGYGEGWLLVHYLMTDPERTARFRDYLDMVNLRPSSDHSHRLEDARKTLGDLEGLDLELRAYAKVLLRRI
jgi:hypothetical protein